MASVQDVITPITITNYSKDAWDGISENNPVAKYLLAKGNIRRNVGGTSATWQLEAGRHAVNIVSDDQDITSLYTPRKRYAQPTINWGQLAGMVRFSKGQFRQNYGDQALVNFRDYEVPALFRDLMVGDSGIFHQFLQQNGGTYSSGGDPLYGLPSIVPTLSWSAGSKTGTVSGTYGGLSVALSGIAVDGAEADAWTPTCVNTTSTAWAGGASNNTFRYNALEILSYGIAKGNRFSSSDPKKKLDLLLFDFAGYNDIGYQIGAKQTIYIDKKVAKGQQQGLGYETNAGLSHAGVPIDWDENAVASTGWGLNFSQIYLDVQPLIGPMDNAKAGLSMSGDDEGLFETEVTYDAGRRGCLVSATFPGQFRINPRYQVYFLNGA